MVPQYRLVTKAHGVITIWLPLSLSKQKALTVVTVLMHLPIFDSVVFVTKL